MKKIIFIVTVFCFSIVNVKALTLKTINSNYFININNSVYKLKKLKDVDTNRVYFNLKYDNYNNLDNYQKNNDYLEIDNVNEISNAIRFGYQSHEKSDIFYYLTQTLIYKYYYGFDNAYMCSSDGTKLNVYDNLIAKIELDFDLKEISDKDIKIFDNLELDSNYEYDLTDFNNEKIGEYIINYYSSDSQIIIYSDNNNYLFEEDNFGKRKGSFLVKVEGIKFSMAGEDTYYQLFEGDNLVKNFNLMNIPEYLKKNTEYLLKYDNKEIAFKTNEDNYELNLLENKEVEKIHISDNLSQQIENPQTKDNIAITILIFLGSWVIYLILYKKYRKSLKN